MQKNSVIAIGIVSALVMLYGIITQEWLIPFVYLIVMIFLVPATGITRGDGGQGGS